MGNKKLLALLATAALAAALALVGCGSSQASSESAASDASASSSAAAESSATAESSSAEASAESPAAAEASSAASSAAAQDSSGYIGEDAAKEIALADAGVAEADCTELNAHLDSDDAVVHYDVDFKAGGMEYDYDIDPTTGDILTAESEIDD